MLPAATARARFREMKSTDLGDVAEALQRTLAEADRWIAWTQRNYADHGYGLWVVETDDGRFVGDCGLTVQDIEGEPFVEVGYHVRPTSAAKAWPPRQRCRYSTRLE